MHRSPILRPATARAAVAATVLAAVAAASAGEPSVTGELLPFESSGVIEAAVPAPTAPMVAEVLADLQIQQERLAALLGELATTTDRGRAFALQREVTALKREAEARMLRIQVAYARREGHVELAEGLEAAVRSLEATPTGETRLRESAPAGR